MSSPNPAEWASAPPPIKPPDRGHWAAGLGIAFGCIALVVPLAFLVGGIASMLQPEGALVGLMVAMVFGLSQWLFVIPAGIFLHRRGKPNTAMGLWITAGVAMLLNGACFGLLAGTSFH